MLRHESKGMGLGECSLAVWQSQSNRLFASTSNSSTTFPRHPEWQDGTVVYWRGFTGRVTEHRITAFCVRLDRAPFPHKKERWFLLLPPRSGLKARCRPL